MTRLDTIDYFWGIRFLFIVKTLSIARSVLITLTSYDIGDTKILHPTYNRTCLEDIL
jgi:hypothetical protein